MSETAMKEFVFVQDVTAKDEVNENSLTLTQNYSTALVEKYNFNVAYQYVPSVYRTFFRVIAVYLKSMQSKNKKKIGFRFNDDHGNMIFGATLSYIEGEEGEDSGNWILAYTFDPSDLEGADEVVDNQKDMFVAICQTEMYHENYGNFGDPPSMNRMFEQCIISLKEFLDANSDDGSPVQLTMLGIFTAAVGFENGERVYSITPGAQIKQLIKNDDALSN